MSDPKKSRALVVRQLSDRKAIHFTDVTGRSEREVEKVERGMLMRIDTERFFLDDTARPGYDGPEFKSERV